VLPEEEKLQVIDANRPTKSSFQKPHGDYGFDNPSGIFFLGGVVLVFWGLVVVLSLLGHWLTVIIGGFLGLFPLATLVSYVYSTRKGKLLVWSELLDDLQLRGEEQVLDMGCGRGAVLSMAAKRLDRGHAFGLDLWSTVDQSGNSPEATLRNLEVDGVKDRCTVETGNMMAMPFANAMFDLVVSNLAIHNIKGQAGRFKALDETFRVLKMRRPIFFFPVARKGMRMLDASAIPIPSVVASG
jgi:arsenite methyltransferase